MSQLLTRNDARAAFTSGGLSYAVLTSSNLRRLRALVNEAMRESGLIKGTYRCRQRGAIKEAVGGRFAELRCRSFYFDNREVVTFNPDGFIGFAGWADAQNVQPILAGFVAWCRELAALQQGAA